MGDFLIIQSSPRNLPIARELFQQGVGISSRLKGQQPKVLMSSPEISVVAFSRANGTGANFWSDDETGSWLLAVGNWFHRSGYQLGEEAQLLRDFLRMGAESVISQLEGFFVISVYDPRSKEMVVCTDLIGSCHSFMRSWTHSTAISGSSFLLASLGECQLDPVACQEYLYGGVIYENRTFYKGIRKLGPSSLFRFHNGSLKSEKPYWKISGIDLESLNGETAVNGLAETLIQATKRIGEVYPHPVCDLTGGYDSRTLISAFLKTGLPLTTTVSGPSQSPDVTVASLIAQAKGFPHIHLLPQGNIQFQEVKNAFLYTDGEYDLLDYARIFRVQKTLSERFDISLNGSFGEVGRGYWWELLYPHTGQQKQLDSERLARYRYGPQGYFPLISHSQGGIDLVSHLRHVIEKTMAGLDSLPNTSQMDHVYLVMRMQRWQGKIASSTNRLWPCLSPFLFRSVLETMLRVNFTLRRRSLLHRTMIEKLDPQMAKFPLEHGYPAIPFRWDTALRFWPLPIYYGKKAFRKILNKMTLSRPSEVLQSKSAAMRISLWKDEEVINLLEPKHMKSLSLCEDTRVEKFLNRSKSPEFPFHDQWARLLSLEFTLQTLSQPKKDDIP